LVEKQLLVFADKEDGVIFCGLFYDAVSSKTAQLHGLIEILSWHLPGENEKTHARTSVRMGDVSAKI
jgi:hypothetical protein